MKPQYPFLFLFLFLVISGCSEHEIEDNRDFLDNKAFTFDFRFKAAAESQSGMNEIHLDAQSKEANKKIHLRLDVGQSGSITKISTHDEYHSLETHINGAEYRFYHRNIFDRSKELDGAFLNIELFKHTVTPLEHTTKSGL